MFKRKISGLIIFFLFSLSLIGQVKSYFGGTLNVFGSSGSSPEYTIQGFFNDTSGEYALDSVAVGDILYIQEGATCARLRVDTINSSAGGILDADVYDIDTILLAPPSGMGALMRETLYGSLPRYIPGLSETLLACIRTHMTGKVEELLFSDTNENEIIYGKNLKSSNNLKYIETDSTGTLNAQARIDVNTNGKEIKSTVGKYADDNGFLDIDPDWEPTADSTVLPLIRVRHRGQNNGKIGTRRPYIVSQGTPGNNNGGDAVFQVWFEGIKLHRTAGTAGPTLSYQIFSPPSAAYESGPVSSYAKYYRSYDNNDTTTWFHFRPGYAFLNNSKIIFKSDNSESYPIRFDLSAQDGIDVKYDDGNNTNFNDPLFYMQFRPRYNGIVSNEVAAIQAVYKGDGTNRLGGLNFYTASPGMVNALSIDRGNLGFGAYGVGNKEDSDLSKTESMYAAVFATDGTILEKPISEMMNGNGIISALPAAPVTIDANNNALIIDSTSTTRITAVGTAQGDLIVSGNTSLPSSLSHIAGSDTAQINLRAGVGLDIVATQDIQLQADTIRAANSVFSFIDGFNSDDILHADASNMSILSYGNRGLGLVDPIGIMITHTNTLRNVTVGDSENEYNQVALRIRDATDQAFLGNQEFGYRYQGNTITAGDYSGGGNGTGLHINDAIYTVKLGDVQNNGGLYLKIDNNAYQMGMGNFSTSDPGMQVLVEDDYDLANIYIGDVEASRNNTLLTVNDNTQRIIINAQNGVEIRKSGVFYPLAITNPAATPDSLDRAMTWRRIGTNPIANFKVVNDSDYRTLNATGNILPYDDYIELDPSVTAHLPAPSVTFRGKVYHIIAGGGVGPGTPVTIDVVDGSNTIETGASLSIDGPFESYSVVCNGSQWIIISDTTTP